MSIKKAMDVLRIYSNFLITTHVNPEGDALGSQLALAQLLEAMGKKAIMLNEHKVPYVYDFMPKSGQIRTRIDKNLDYDIAVVMDCPTMERIGRVNEALKEGKMILNIDHHVSNAKFGKVNWINEKASSCGEMVYTLFKELDCKIDKDIAVNLYTAILTDTGSFKYTNTTSQTHRIAGELIDYGLNVYAIQKSIYERRTLNELKLLGLALSDMQTEAEGKIAYFAVTRKMIGDAGIELKGTEEFVNFPRSLDNVEVALFFREEKEGSVHVSFRSKSELDVSRIATSLGGGGHAKAAGCLIKGTMEEVKQRVLAEVKKEMTGGQPTE